jgi:hypothetical protein
MADDGARKRRRLEAYTPPISYNDSRSGTQSICDSFKTTYATQTYATAFSLGEWDNALGCGTSEGVEDTSPSECCYGMVREILISPH